MDLSAEIPLYKQGIGATAEAQLARITPLIEYYEREMGELPGRLMIAASFLRDLPMMPGCPHCAHAQTPEAVAAVEQASALVVSVMVRLLNGQDGCECTSGDGKKNEFQQGNRVTG